MVTLPNFTVYLKHHLTKHHTSAVPHPSDPRAAPSSLPRPFTIGDLLAAKRLARFAGRLAQRRAGEKRQARVRSARGLPPAKAGGGEAWVGEMGEGGLEGRRSGGAGGTSGFLPPPSSAGGSPAGTKRGRGEEGRRAEEKVLGGGELEKAVRRVFVEGLQEMRKKGVIVVAEPEEDGRLGMVGVEDDGEGVGSFEVSERSIEGSSWGSSAAWDSSAASTKAPVAEDFWLAKLRGGDDNQATPKATRSTRLDLPTPRPSLHLPPSATRPTTPTSANLSTASWTTSALHALDPDAFLLVTPSFLARRLAEILAPAGGARLTEHEVRVRLARDERWRAVAECSEVVGRARREAEEGWEGRLGGSSGGGASAGRGPQAEREAAVFGGGGWR